MTNAITATNGSAELMRPAFAQDHIALIRQLVMQSVDRPPTDTEMQLFLMTCQRTGLDPLMRQIYCIERRQNKGGQWVSKFETQLSIDGMRLVAERTDRYEGQVGPLWCGADGEWRDVWVLDTPPVAAKVGVWKRGFREPLWAVALYGEYVQTTRDKQSGRDTPTRFWQRMPALMLAKCAESLALRKAFPHELSGLYTREEMSQAESDETAYHAPQLAPVSDPVVTQPAIRNPDHPASEQQVKAIYGSAKGAGIPMADVDACLADFDPLTKAQASAIIDLIKTRGELPPSPHAPQPAKPAGDEYLEEIGRLRQDLDWSKKQLADYIRSEGFDPAHLTELQAGRIIDWLVIKAGEYQSVQQQGGLMLSQLTDEELAIEAAITPGRNGAAGVAR